jgi:hypothetical protein
LKNSRTEESKRKRSKKHTLIYILYCVVVIVVILEIGFRVLTRTEDQHDLLLGLKLLPFARITDTQLEILATSPSDWTYYRPDPDLGWSIKPNGQSRDGLFFSNNLGLRDRSSDAVATLAPQKHRVLLVGDSFTHGDEIPFESTWGYQLSELLGNNYSVYNAGAGGYGNDQALLRWRKLRATIQPQTVIFGIYSEDLWRNLTFFRVLKHHWSSFPFSKPRFVRRDGKLELKNSPVIAPELVAETLRSYASHPLSPDDLLDFPEFYTSSFADSSRLLRWLRTKRFYSKRHDVMMGYLDREGQGTLLAADLAALFLEECSAQGSKPIIILIPGAEDLPGYSEDHPLDSGGRLRNLALVLRSRELPYLDLGHALRAELGDKDRSSGLQEIYVRGTGHPTQLGCQIIARTLKAIINP